MNKKMIALRERLGPLWWHTLIMFIVSRLGDAVSLVIAVFIVPDLVSKQKLGAVLPLVKLAVLLVAPMTIVANTVMKYVSVFSVRGENGKIKSLICDLAVLNVVLSGVVISFLVVGQNLISGALKISDNRIIWLLGAIVMFACWTPIVTMISRGVKDFQKLTWSKLVGPMARLVVVVLLLKRFQLVGYLAGNLAQPVVVVMLLVWGLRKYVRPSLARESYTSYMAEMRNYAIPVGVMTLLLAFQVAAEPWLIRRYLSTTASAGYYMATMFGTVPLWVTGAVLPFFFPLVSELFEQGKSTRKIHLQALGVVAVLGVGIAFFFGLCSNSIFALKQSWSEHMNYAGFVWQIALITTMDVLIRCHAMHETACHRFTFLRYLCPLVLAEIGTLAFWGCLEASQYKNVLPIGILTRTLSLGFFVDVMLVSRICIILFMLNSLRRNPVEPISGTRNLENCIHV